MGKKYPISPTYFVDGRIVTIVTWHDDGNVTVQFNEQEFKTITASDLKRVDYIIGEDDSSE